jgi:hypothetical protein
MLMLQFPSVVSTANLGAWAAACIEGYLTAKAPTVVG